MFFGIAGSYRPVISLDVARYPGLGKTVQFCRTSGQPVGSSSMHVIGSGTFAWAVTHAHVGEALTKGLPQFLTLGVEHGLVSSEVSNLLLRDKIFFLLVSRHARCLT